MIRHCQSKEQHKIIFNIFNISIIIKNRKSTSGYLVVIINLKIRRLLLKDYIFK